MSIPREEQLSELLAGTRENAVSANVNLIKFNSIESPKHVELNCSLDDFLRKIAIKTDTILYQFKYYSSRVWVQSIALIRDNETDIDKLAMDSEEVEMLKSNFAELNELLHKMTLNMPVELTLACDINGTWYTCTAEDNWILTRVNPLSEDERQRLSELDPAFASGESRITR